MNLRFAIRGVFVWAVATLILRLLPSAWVDRPHQVFLVTAAVSAVSLALGTLWTSRKLPPEARPAAIAAFVVPQMVGDAVVTALFSSALPNFSPDHDAVFGALVLWAYAVMLATALFASRSRR